MLFNQKNVYIQQIHKYILFNNNIIVYNFWPGCDSSLDILSSVSFISQFKKRQRKRE